MEAYETPLRAKSEIGGMEVGLRFGRSPFLVNRICLCVTVCNVVPIDRNNREKSSYR